MTLGKREWQSPLHRLRGILGFNALAIQHKPLLEPGRTGRYFCKLLFQCNRQQPILLFSRSHSNRTVNQSCATTTPVAAVTTDPTSTRLNSSHVKISYAFF